MKREKRIQVEEMEKILEQVRKQCIHIYYREKKKTEYFKQDAFIIATDTYLSVSFCLGLKPCTYMCRLDDKFDAKQVTAGQVRACVRKYYKEQEIKKEKIDKLGSAKPLLYKNNKFNGVRVKAYGYDMRHAYNFFSLWDWPDTDNMREYSTIRDGEIGFVEVGPDLRLVTEIGRTCDYVCPTMKCPQGIVNYTKKWLKLENYSKKQIARLERLMNKTTDKDKLERYKDLWRRHNRNKIKAKNFLTHYIGGYQHSNPFIRATIVGRCNLFMKNLIDDNTIYCNTDSIISTVRRPDIERMAGDKIGNFKLERGFEKDEYFAWQKDVVNYQWNFESPTYRGQNKLKFDKFSKEHGRPWDILVDEKPDSWTPYIFDKDKLRIRRNK